MCLTACFLATGDLSFYYCCMFGPQQGLHLLCLIFYSKIHVASKMYAILGMSEVFVYLYIRSNQKIFIFFEWNVKATLNLLTYHILNLQGESYKTGIQAGPYNSYFFLFSYFSLHFNENALLLSSLLARRWVGLQTL